MDSAQQLFDLAREQLPPGLRPPAERHWESFRDHLGSDLPNAGIERWLPLLPRVFALSEFLARTWTQYPEIPGGLIESGDLFRAPMAGEIARRVELALAPVADEAELKRVLRELRRREMTRIAWRDLAGWADLAETVAGLSEFADAGIGGALERLHAWAAHRHGTPTGEQSRHGQQLVVLGMGKLGGRELNFSSDVDLIFAYPEDGDTDGARPLSNHEFFVQLSQALIRVLSEPTGDGFVFRVDMRLRPHGGSGALAASFDAMEQYYQTHGREWERYAFIKARVVAGDRSAGAGLLDRLRPFVYRKYLDYGAFDAMRAMKGLIEREVARKELQGNVKLGPGGIREIEFVAQALQLIRGSREPALQEPNLLTVLPRLTARGYLEPDAGNELAAAYVFLRNLEHRLQMVNDAQTHLLPDEPVERARLAFAMDFADAATFDHALADHRAHVQTQFTRLFAAAPTATEDAAVSALLGAWLGTATPDAARATLQAAKYDAPNEAIALLDGLRTSAVVAALSTEGRTRLDKLMPLLIVAAGREREPTTVLARLVNLIEAIGRRSAYFSLLVENATALNQLVKLAHASPWIANWIGQHPILLDELIDPRGLSELPTAEQLQAELTTSLAQAPEDELESAMERLREFRHAHVLRVAAADIGPGLAPEHVGAALATIADVVIDASLNISARDLTRRHGAPQAVGNDAAPGFAVIGYGKLGSRELGYASDLDLIYLYQDAEGASTHGARPIPNELYFARLGSRLIHLLTTRTRSGNLYEVDMRLRPSGNAGPLVTSLAAFERYQTESAWTWEHQALVRARAVAGSATVRREFERVRLAVLSRARDPIRLRADLLVMRARMFEAHGAKSGDEFDVKHDRGGLVDIEFMVQYWVLRWAGEHPDIARSTENITILESLAGCGLVPAGRAELLVRAYRRYLSTEHHLKLMERGSRCPRAELGDLPDVVQRVWRDVFDE